MLVLVRVLGLGLRLERVQSEGERIAGRQGEVLVDDEGVNVVDDILKREREERVMKKVSRWNGRTERLAGW